METVTVRGVEVPALGFGTARMTGEGCYEAVRDALEVGYRHVDTAQMYDNEAAVGDAVADAAVSRGEVFVTTKVDPDNLAPEDVRESVAASLDRLGTDYADLLLVHAPSDEVPVADSLAAMNDLREAGSVRHVGVSNFSVAQTREAMAASEAPILTNQVEYHPRRQPRDLLAFCIEHDVLLTAYSPLGVGDLSDDPVLAEIGDRRGKTPAQVALRWLLDQPSVATVPKAAAPAHRRENFDVFDFDLADGEVERVFEIEGALDDRLRSALGL